MRVEELETPALVVDLDVLETNLREMAAYCAGHGLALRPHVKTHKTPAIARMQISSGARGITVAKLGEAEVMARAGIQDILIAYPIVGRAKLERLVALARMVRVLVSVDSLEVAREISRAVREAGVTVGVLAEYDAGLRRCGVQTPDDLVSLAHEMARLQGLDFLGILFFPGHVRAKPSEQAPVLRKIDERLREAQDKLFRWGIGLRVVSGGSTPTAFQSHVMKTVTEIRPGTYVFNDFNTVAGGAAELSRCALTVHVTVVSTAVKGRAVIDGGSKTFSSDRLRGGDAPGFGYCVDLPGLILETMSEEHGHLDVENAGRPLKIGERLRFIPNHVCTALNLHSEIWGARNGEVAERWEIQARGLVK